MRLDRMIGGDVRYFGIVGEFRDVFGGNGNGNCVYSRQCGFVRTAVRSHLIAVALPYLRSELNDDIDRSGFTGMQIARNLGMLCAECGSSDR
jgi:hypothetical protein